MIRRTLIRGTEGGGCNAKVEADLACWRHKSVDAPCVTVTTGWTSEGLRKKLQNREMRATRNFGHASERVHRES